MTIPPRHILEEAFRSNFPDAVVEAIRRAALQEGRMLAAKVLSDSWITQNGGLDKFGCALWMRKEMMKQMGNE